MRVVFQAQQITCQASICISHIALFIFWSFLSAELRVECGKRQLLVLYFQSVARDRPARVGASRMLEVTPSKEN